jgi:hypothetical protein
MVDRSGGMNMLKKIGMFVVVSTLIAGCSTGPIMQMFSDKKN